MNLPRQFNERIGFREKAGFVVIMVNVAILGYGVVGSGVAEVINKNAGQIANKAAHKIKVKYILDIRDFSSDPNAELFIKDFSIIENDPEVQVVVETIGGTGAAFEFTKRAFLAGKNVVTSNKELVAEHGFELLKLAKERNLNYLFEASVGGGIPIIRPISQCLAANELNEIYGILNGTTNYILTGMIKRGLTFETALSEAQQKGYAEANPSADIEGKDTCRKICILASLAFGRHIYPAQVETEGIKNISLRDVNYAKTINRRIKLLGRARKTEDGKICAYVAPHLISEENLLANVEDVFNGIVVRGDVIGDVMFYGRGAGKLPTASAVVADIIDAAKHFTTRKYLGWEQGDENVTSDTGSLISRFYIRAKDDIDKLQEIFGEIEVLKASDSPKDETAFLTKEIRYRDAKEKMKLIRTLSFIRLLE